MFDRTLIITIPRSGERFLATMQHLHERGIHPERFEGIDWQDSGLNTNYKYEVDNPRSGFKISERTVNLFMSHFILWKCAEHMRGDSFLVLEDDARFEADWRDHMAHAMLHLPHDWDLFYPGSCCCEGRDHKHISGRLYKTDFALCTHAYAFRRKAIPKLLQGCNRVWTGVDIAMLFGAIPHLNTFVLLPRIVHQHETKLTP